MRTNKLGQIIKDMSNQITAKDQVINLGQQNQ